MKCMIPENVIQGTVCRGNVRSANCPFGELLPGIVHWGNVRRGEVHRGTVRIPQYYCLYIEHHGNPKDLT